MLIIYKLNFYPREYPDSNFDVQQWSINNLQTTISYRRRPCEPPAFDATLGNLDLEDFLSSVCLSKSLVFILYQK